MCRCRPPPHCTRIQDSATGPDLDQQPCTQLPLHKPHPCGHLFPSTPAGITMQPILDLHAVSLSPTQIPFSPLDEPLSATASSPTLISALPDPSAPQLPLSQPPGTPLCYGAFPYTHASPSSSSTDESISPTTPTRRLRRQPSPLSPSRDDDGLVLRGTSFVHPYARLYSKRQGAGKRRKMWNHTLEKLLFSPQEMWVSPELLAKLAADAHLR